MGDECKELLSYRGYAHNGEVINLSKKTEMVLIKMCFLVVKKCPMIHVYCKLSFKSIMGFTHITYCLLLIVHINFPDVSSLLVCVSGTDGVIYNSLVIRKEIVLKI